MVKFFYKPIKYNFSSRKGSKIRFIVIHDTGNPGRGADAMNHYRYFGGGNRNSSAHYFVDSEQIVQIIGDSYSAWHAGDTWAKKYATRSDVFNKNSLGIEMCINSDGSYTQMYEHAVELVKNLMKKFGIPADRVVRHFDATGKSCPNHMRKNSWAQWWKFKEDIKKPLKIKMDLSKDSTGVYIDQEEALKEREEAVKEDPSKKHEEHVEKDPILKDLGERFEAVEPSAWARDIWTEAIDLGLTDGTAPKRYASREEVAAMILRALKGEDHGKRHRTDDSDTGYRTGL